MFYIVGKLNKEVQVFKITIIVLCVLCGMVSWGKSNYIEIQEEVSTTSTLFYKIREAKTSDKPPVLIILLHGYGANEDDLLSLAQTFPDNYIVVTPQAPYKIGAGSYQWYTISRNERGGFEGEATSVDLSIGKITSLIKQLQKKYAVPASRTFLAGFSQGANMSYQVGLNYPQLLRGIGAWSGTIFDSLKDKLKAKKASPLLVFIGHGDLDNRIPYKEGVESKAWLDALSYHAELHSYKGMGHSISQEELKDFNAFISKALK